VHRHNDLLFPLVEKDGGRIVKTIGDAIMAVYPTALQAASSAVAMQQALEDDAKKTGKEPIRIRIGVHSGSVLKDKDDVFGDTVNVAARLTARAEPGTILVSPDLAAALDDVFTLDARGEMALKGKSEAMPVFEVVGRA
jgi:adenylate cyclase